MIMYAFNFHPSFSSASFPLFLFSLVILFFFFFFFFFFLGFLYHCHCETTPLQEDIITHTSGVTSHYIVLHPVSSRASRTFGVQFICHSWLVDNLVPRVFRLFGQRGNAGNIKFYHRRISAVKQWKPLRNSQSKKLNFFDVPRVFPALPR